MLNTERRTLKFSENKNHNISNTATKYNLFDGFLRQWMIMLQYVTAWLDAVLRNQGLNLTIMNYEADKFFL